MHAHFIPNLYESKTRCTCGATLYSRDRSNGYGIRVEWITVTGQPMRHCPGCGRDLTAPNYGNQKADAVTSASGQETHLS